MTQMQNSQCEIDEKHKIGKWFTGLIPCWIDAPSTLQASHSHHGKNIVAIHLKDGGYRCCCIDDKEPMTFSLPENTPLVEGWHRESAVWDGKDEERIKNILSVLDVQECWDGATGKKMNPYQKEIDWLKSIKSRNTWKPNARELEVLRLTAERDGTCLMGLYEKLKKLR